MYTRYALRVALLALTLVAPTLARASGHREAPIAALDPKADITDVYAFRSYSAGPPDGVPRVTFIMSVDAMLEPAGGPIWSPFDPEILYEINIDNNDNAVKNIFFKFRFTTQQRLPAFFQSYAGVPGGAFAPLNSPPDVDPGTLIIPPRISAFGDAGLGLRQSYTVTMVKEGVSTPLVNGDGSPFFAVPPNVGPRTMDYDALLNAGIYSLANGIKVFAGATDDAFWADLGGLYDTFNTHVFPILTPVEDAALQNFSSDALSGYAVNSIAIEVPVSMLTHTGNIEPASSPAATIGVWGATSRRSLTERRSPSPSKTSGTFKQIQRMGNPFVNALLIGNASKDRFSMDTPQRDSQFVSFVSDPEIARVVNALTAGAVAIPAPPRVDLNPLLHYAPPIAAAGTTAGPTADLLRLNTGVPPTLLANVSRLGLLGGDAAGFPNGRRVFDDVTDIMLRLVVGGVLAGPFAGFDANIGGRLGDGVNVNDALYRTAFPYLGNAPSGTDRRHIDPGEPGCTAGLGAACPP